MDSPWWLPQTVIAVGIFIDLLRHFLGGGHLETVG
jgi:hypothetical protein